MGGALGALARYGLSRAVGERDGFPWATFAINVSGCLLIGVALERLDSPEWLRVGVIVGVLGGYTTFSAFGNETLDLLDSNRVALGLAYAVGSVVVGVTAVWVGAMLGRTF